MDNGDLVHLRSYIFDLLSSILYRQHSVFFSAATSAHRVDGEFNSILALSVGFENGHLITLSARISTFSGIVRPICWRRVLVLHCVGWRWLASEGTLLIYVEIF